MNAVASGWLRQYIDYASALTDSPVVFHLAVGLAVLATACGSRVTFRGAGNKEYWPNLYTLFIAPSGLMRKTTTIDMGTNLLRRVDPDAVLPNETSREQFLEMLATGPERLIRESEFASALSRYSRDYMCVDEATECLTEDGWKSIDTLAEGDRLIGLAERGPTTYLEAVPVRAIHRYGVTSEEMVSVETRSLSMLTTKNHMVRLATQRAMVRADALPPYAQLLQVARWGAGAGRFGLSGEGRKDKRDRARAAVLGWYLTEGSASDKKVRIAQKNHVPELMRDLEDSQFEWQEQAPKSNGVRIFGLSRSASAWLQEWAPAKVPTWRLLREWSRAALQRLWDTLLLGDGHVRENGGAVAFTQQPGAIRDFFQALGLRLGYRTVFRDSMVASITRNRRCVLTKGSSPRLVQYSGRVWCPESALGTFVARRNGTVYITGNSGMKELVTDLYDCQPEYRRQIKGRDGTGTKLIIRRPALNYLAASTIEWLIDSLTMNDMRSGFMARFLIFPAASKGKWVSFIPELDPRDEDSLAELLGMMRRIHGATVDFRAILKDLNVWARQQDSTAELAAPETMGFHARMTMHCVKVAVLLEVSDQGPQQRYIIGDNAFQRACLLMEWLRDRYDELAERKLVFSKEERQMQGIMDTVRKDGKVEWSMALKRSHMKTQDFQRYLQTLLDRKEVFIVTEQTRTKPARMISLLNSNGKLEGKVMDMPTMYRPKAPDPQ